METIKKTWPIVISAIIAGLVYMVSIQTNDNLDSLKQSLLASIIALLITVIFRIQQIEDIIITPSNIVERFTKLLSTIPRINNTVNYAHNISEKKDRYHDFFLETIFEDYNHRLQSVSQGKFVCDPDSELNVTKKVLECCDKILKAISYQDEEWWCGNDGVLYLDAHAKYIDRENEKAIRIFLIDFSSRNKFKEVFKRHNELGIETYVLFTDRDNIDDKYKIDFVIYDDYILRHANNSSNKIGKEATFTSDNVQVNKFSNLFEEILTIAKVKNNNLPI